MGTQGPYRRCRAPRHADGQVAGARHARRNRAEDGRGIQGREYGRAQDALRRGKYIGRAAQRALERDRGRRNERRREQTRDAEQKRSVELSLRCACAPHARSERPNRRRVKHHPSPVGRDFGLGDAGVQQLLGDQGGHVEGRARLERAEDCRRPANAHQSQSQRLKQQDHSGGDAQRRGAHCADAAFGEEHARENGDDGTRCGRKDALDAEQVQRGVREIHRRLVVALGGLFVHGFGHGHGDRPRRSIRNVDRPAHPHTHARTHAPRSTDGWGGFFCARAFVRVRVWSGKSARRVTGYSAQGRVEGWGGRGFGGGRF